MPHEIVITEDGSHTIKITEQNVTYHSMYGAVTESKHIFVDGGLHYIGKRQMSILEVGFGTGLNALLTLIEAEKNDLQILYDVVELYPLDIAHVAPLNYLRVLNASEYADTFLHMHNCEWEAMTDITPRFRFRKMLADICEVSLQGTYDVVYFDAFDPGVQPRLWTTEVFKKIFNVMDVGGVLMTYSAKGSVRRSMAEAGFGVEKLVGPKGKREIVRARKS